MRPFIILFALAFSNILSAQLNYTPISYNQVSIDGYEEALYIGNGQAAIISDGIPYHLSFDSEYNFTINYVENASIEQDLLFRYDVNRDGNNDLLTIDINNSGLNTYLNINQGLDDVAAFFSGNMASFAAQDFDGDGVDDLIVNGRVYTHNEDGSTTRILNRLPSNDYVFKSPYAMDINEDGLQDVVFQLVTNLGYLRNDGEGRLRLELFSALNHQCRWMNVIETQEGPVVIYYDSDNSIYKLDFNAGEVSKTLLVDAQPNFGFKTIATDLNQDGNEELIIYSTATNYYYLLDYDIAADTASYERITFNGGEGILYVDDDSKPKLIGLSKGSIDVYEANQDLEIIHIKNSINSTNVYPSSFVDVNGDGFVDVYNSDYIRDYYGNGEFSNIKDFALPDTGGKLEDYDSDGDADYVKDDVWYENLNDNTFGPSQENILYIPYPDPDVFFTNIVYEGDIDEDGDIDLLTYNVFGEPFELLENNNNQYFEDPVRLADNDLISGNLIDLYLTDMNGDGTKDILMATVSGVVWWPQSAGLSFADGIVLHDDNFSPRSIDVRDGNNDGFNDVVIGTGELMAGMANGSIHIFRGSAEGPTLAGSSAISNGYKYTAFIDYNEDGFDDIIVSDGSSLALHIFSDYETWSNNSAIVKSNFDLFGSYIVTDVDGDADEDIIIYDDGGFNVEYILKDELISINQCPINNVKLLTQEQVNLFGSRFNTCKEINGDVFIGGLSDWSDINNLSSLSSIKKVHGSLTLNFMNKAGAISTLPDIDSIGGSLSMRIIRPSNFDFLKNLSHIGKDLIFNNVLASNPEIIGFGNLDHIGRNISVSITNLPSFDPIIVGNKVNGDLKFDDTYEVLTNISALSQLDTVIGTFELQSPIIEDLTILENLDYVGGLHLAGIQLKTVKLDLQQDSIPFDFRIATNNSKDSEIIHSLKLKYVGGDVFLSANDIGSFHDLEYVEANFFARGDDLDDISFNKLKTVRSFNISFNNKEDFSNFKNLEKVRGGFSGGRIKSLNGLVELDSILGSFTIGFNPNITNLNGIKDELYVGGEWGLFQNSNLNYCESPALCNHLEAGREYYISENASSCDDISDIQCLSSSVSGITFYDHNENGVYEEDTEARLADIELNFENDLSTTITGNNGFYRRHLLEGQSFSVEATPNTNFSFTTPNFYEVDSFIPDVSGIDNFDFGFVSTIQDITYTTAINSSLFICNRDFEISSKIINTSAEIGNGYVLVTYSSKLELNPDFTDFSEHNEENRTIKIDFTGLNPYFSLDLNVPFIAPSAEELFNNSHYVNIEIFQLEGVDFIKAHEDYIPLALLCSYDPNDKLVSSTDRTGNIRVNETEDELIYTIRFQNTGNFYAEDIRITDQVAENLDLSTFRFLDASHEVEIFIRDRELTFMFEDIFLTDSTSSFIESQGFVSFSIKPLSSDVLDESFDNQAYIYFDFNEPIITNVAESIVYDPTVDVYDKSFDGVNIYPIPASQYINIELDNWSNFERFEIFNIIGAKAIQGKINGTTTQVDLGALRSGSYLVRLYSNDNNVVNKRMVIGR